MRSFSRALLPALLASSFLSPPASAVQGISLDGASLATAYKDPNYVPQGTPGLRYGAVSFRYSSIGQVNDGDVQYFTTMFPSNQTDGPFKIRFVSPLNVNDIGDGQTCPFLQWDIDNKMGNNDDGSLDNQQLRQYLQDDCDQRPDPHLFASGAKMGIELLMHSIDGGWLLAIFEQAAPMNGQQYTITLTWSTGEANIGPPYAKILVTKRGDPPGTSTMVDADYLDASYWYGSGDGFDVPFDSLFWQFGCDTTDNINYVDTCWTGLTAEFWLLPANDEDLPEITPLNTFLGFFLSGDNEAAPFLGTYGQMPTGAPPDFYNSGDDTHFIINLADVGYGLTEPQTFISQSWYQDGSLNPNFLMLGAGIQASGQDF